MDYVIIGGGISGLYTAHLLEKKYPSRSIVLFESTNEFGGRAKMSRFHETNIVQGAGVGRYGKDDILYRLWKLAVCPESLQIFSSKIEYMDFEPVDILAILQELKQKNPFDSRHEETFQSFFLRHYPKEIYQHFLWTNGFTDFEKADIVDTLFDYGFEDNVSSSHFFRIDWNRLVQYLLGSLQHTKLYLKHKVKSVIQNTGQNKTSRYRIYVNDSYVNTRNVIWAGHFQNGYRAITKLDLSLQIGYNPFLRYYTYLKEKIPKDFLHRSYYRCDHLQKTIPLNEHVVMWSYSDNQNAMRSRRQLKRKDSVSFFWSHGTHYYKPLSRQWSNRQEFIDKAQHPQEGCFLVGELISRNQGWTEGALESVHAILPYL
jgi:hypothetical protein